MNFLKLHFIDFFEVDDPFFWSWKSIFPKSIIRYFEVKSLIDNLVNFSKSIVDLKVLSIERLEEVMDYSTIPNFSGDLQFFNLYFRTTD